MVRSSTIFTTHTPVPAGHDAFPFSLVETDLAGVGVRSAPIRDQFLALGHYDNGSGPLFNMTALALRTSNFVNGVSQLHGQVTRDMWAPIWPGVDNDHRPVRAITNGVHVPTWLSMEMTALLDEFLPGNWARQACDNPGMWEAINGIPDERLGEARPGAALTYLFAFHPRARAASAGKTSTSPPRASSLPAPCSIPMP